MLVVSSAIVERVRLDCPQVHETIERFGDECDKKGI